MLRYLIPLTVFILLVGLFIVGLRYDPRLVPSPLIDKPAPSFELPQLKASEKKISNSDLLGEVVMLNVWASWCVACRQEHPLLVELAKNTDFKIIGLNYKDARKDAMQWLAHYGDPYFLSIVDLDGRVGIDFGVYGVPETFILDQAGIIRYKHIGPITQEVLDSKILPLIKRLEKNEDTLARI
jgi:cytochrome c biogenesis protein CcmG/thiol:disulfide interchange protein DsbE